MTKPTHTTAVSENGRKFKDTIWMTMCDTSKLAERYSGIDPKSILGNCQNFRIFKAESDSETAEYMADHNDQVAGVIVKTNSFHDLMD